MNMTLTAVRFLGTVLAPALAVAGCAVAHSSATAASHAAATTAHPAAATALPPEQRAEADAAAILAAFVVPPGARKLPGVPQGQAIVLKYIADSGSPNRIDRAGFWQVKGDPQQVLAWTASHVGRSHTDGGLITNLPTPGQPETVWERDYALPPVPAVEDTRELTVEVADAGNGQTAIRVDAQVTWLPAREASETVPAAATAVVMSVTPDGNLNAPPPPVTVTSAETVRRVTAMVNSPLGVPHQGNALAATVLKTAGTKWNLAAYVS